MSKKWRLTDRTRALLTLELAIVLPAAALMGFSIWNLKHIRKMKEEDPWGFYGGWTLRANQHAYWNVAYFIPKGVPPDRVALGIVAFDEDYLRKSFFPAVVKDVLSGKSTVLRADANLPVMMIHAPRDSAPWVASADWDGGSPEEERRFADVFPDLILAIKYRGTTIADIGSRFLRYNYIVLASLSVLMVGGIWLTYRNVSREMNLARLKSDLVANVSHELRTALALMRLYGEAVELGRLTAKKKYQEYFRTIREESERLTALINNILDFSRIEA